MFPFSRRNKDPYADLLKSRRSNGSFFKKLIIVVLLGGIGAFIYAYTQDWIKIDWLEDYQKSRQPIAIATSNAKQRVEKAVTDALLPATVKVRNSDSAPKVSDAESANVVPGKTTLLRGKLVKNQTLISALIDRGVEVSQTHAPIAVINEIFNFRFSRPGDQWEAEIGPEGAILYLKYQTSPEDIYMTTRDQDDNYHAEKVVVPITTTVANVVGKVDGSLWGSLEGAGASPALAVSFLEIFAYAVDFHSIMQNGDQFAMIYERISVNGEFLRTGRVLATRYLSSEQVYDAFYDTTVPDNESEYYDANGEGMQGSFLKSPLSSVRITSKFGQRFHPVLGRMKAHNGVDYGAPVGTPIQVVADGVVTWAARKGPNGNLIVVKHDNGYTTHYAHLSKILVKKGAEVKKKDIIGKVGSTGRSTGPHLHFGMAKNGKWVNPLKVKFPRVASLTGERRKKFLTDVVEPMTKALDEILPQPEPTSIATTPQADP